MGQNQLLTEVYLSRDDPAVPAVGELDSTIDRSVT